MTPASPRSGGDRQGIPERCVVLAVVQDLAPVGFPAVQRGPHSSHGRRVAELCRRASERSTRGSGRVNVPTVTPDVGWTAAAILTMRTGTVDDAYVVK